jgi:hypothetical protein
LKFLRSTAPQVRRYGDSERVAAKCQVLSKIEIDGRVHAVNEIM